MDVANIKLGKKYRFRTMKMDAAKADHVGKATAFHDTEKGKWIEFETADGGTLKTRAGLVNMIDKAADAAA